MKLHCTVPVSICIEEYYGMFLERPTIIHIHIAGINCMICFGFLNVFIHLGWCDQLIHVDLFEFILHII